MPVDQRVRDKRKRLYTIEELSALLGISPATLSRIERQPIKPVVLAYLRAIGYRVTFNPVFKRGKQEEGV